MTPAQLTTWDELATDAERIRGALWHHVRDWAAAVHVTTRARTTSGRVWAALDATARPARVRLVTLHDHTPRERAEAEALDLWDAVAAVWSAVNHAHDVAQAVHVVAELHTAGRWLASFPVHAARHELAMAELFNAEVVA